MNTGILLQMLIQNTLGEKKNQAGITLGVDFYLLTFYTFAIVFTFPMYKEMKVQLLQNLGIIGGGGDNSFQDQERPPVPNIVRNQTNNNSQNNPPNSQGGFVAFSGRGVAVG